MKKATLLLLSILLATTCQAADLDGLSPVKRGNLYFAAKEYQKSYDAFFEAFMDNPTDLDTSFFLGRAAFENGDYETAIMSYDRILIMEPDSIRVKLELARCHMQLGANETAKQYFYEVLARNPPQKVRSNIELFLAAIAATEKKHFISGMAAVGISYDSNFRSSPGSFLLTFSGSAGDVTFEISSPAEKDHFFTTTLSLNHIYKFEDSPFAWKTTFTNFNNSYLTRASRDLDINFYGLSSGPIYQSNKMLLEAHAYINKLDLDYYSYVQPTGFGASATFLVDPNLMFTVSSGIEAKNYATESDSVKDALNWNISLSPIFTEGNNRFTVTLTKEVENAKQDYWSYDRLKFGVRYDRILPQDFSFFSSFDLKHTDYDLIKPTEAAIRSDDIQEVGIGLNKLLWQTKEGRSLSLQINNTYTEADSNITLYKYRKNVSTALLTYSF